MSRAADTGRPVAVFDFDHTLIDTDVAYAFLDTMIKRSKTRRMAVGLVMPLLLPFLLIPPCRFIVVSTMMWIATFPLRGRQARDVFRAFAPRIKQAPIRGRFYDQGMTAIAAHRRLGHRLLIVSGSPQELVSAVARDALPADITIIGSQVVGLLGGLVYRRYCMRGNKIRLAAERGLLDGRWDYGYSDSAHDIPLLAHCRHRFLVNPTPRTARRVKAALNGDVMVLNWADAARDPRRSA